MKKATIKSLDSIIGRLIHLNSKIKGSELQEAIREVAYIRDRILKGDIYLNKKQ